MVMEFNFIGDELDVRMLTQNFDVNPRKILTRTITVGKDLYQIDHYGEARFLRRKTDADGTLTDQFEIEPARKPNYGTNAPLYVHKNQFIYTASGSKEKIVARLSVKGNNNGWQKCGKYKNLYFAKKPRSSGCPGEL